MSVHNFEREIRIKVKNDAHRPITEVESKIVESLQQQEQKTPAPAAPTRVIQLKNKNAPQGVHLAIAVENTKYLSKNALKKITRDLAKQID